MTFWLLCDLTFFWLFPKSYEIFLSDLPLGITILNYYLGMWYAILSFLNYAGMITNALILGFTSHYGAQYRNQTIDVQLPANTTAFNNVTNATVTSFPVTVSSSQNLWIVLLFQVSFVLLKRFQCLHTNRFTVYRL